MSLLPPLGSLLLPLALILRPALSVQFASEYTTTNTSGLHDNQKDCTCYTVNSGADSNTPEYFQFYRFYDFRNLAGGPNQYVNTPPLVNDTQDQGQEPVWDSEIFDSDAWTNDWGIQNWSKPSTEDFPIRMVNSPANVYIQQNNDSNDAFTFLTLRTTRLDDFQSAAEIESEQKNLMHVTMRMYARVTGSKGAVAGFFTFFDDTNESDIEILTDDPTDVIRYTNQPAVDKEGNEVAAASLAPDKLPAWDDWQTHRIDWLPKNSYWFLNDKQVAKNTYSIPRTPSYLVINMWSDGGTWSGNMTRGDSAEFQIQWMEIAFNTSGPVEGPPDPDDRGNNKRDIAEEEPRGRFEKRKHKEKGCKVVCKIDSVKEVGTPEVVSRSAAPVEGVSWGLLVVIGVVSMWVGL